MFKIIVSLFILLFSHVSFAQGQCSSPKMYNKDGYLHIISNGVACNHGQFPNSHNPNTISSQSYQFKVTLTPTLTGRSTYSGMNDFGVALDGVPFDPGTAEFYKNDRRSGWNYAAMTGFTNLGLDANHAHVQPNGAYHYHGAPTNLISRLNNASSVQMTLIGYAADGFPIYYKYAHQKADDTSSPLKVMKSSYRLKSGDRPDPPGGNYTGAFDQDFEYVQGLGELDDCNGRRVVSLEYPQGIYSYFVTDDFPYVPRCYKGTPDQSFQKRQIAGQRGGSGFQQRPPPGQGGQGGRRPPPPPRPF